MEALQQSEFWSTGAQLVGLFDWTAIGAILVFLTLLQAVWLAGNGDRRFEGQQTVMLKYVRAQLMKLHTVEKISIGALKSGVPLHDLSALSMIADLEKSFDRIDPMSLPTSASMEAVEQSRSALLTLNGLYDPESEDRDLLKVLLPFTSDYTEYAIKILEREIEDRNPVLSARLFRKLARGHAPSRPDTYLVQAIERVQAAKKPGRPTSSPPLAHGRASLRPSPRRRDRLRRPGA